MAVKIDDNICNGISACPEGGLCIESCPTGAIKNKEDKPNVSYFFMRRLWHMRCKMSKSSNYSCKKKLEVETTLLKNNPLT